MNPVVAINRLRAALGSCKHDFEACYQYRTVDATGQEVTRCVFRCRYCGERYVDYGEMEAAQ